MKCIHCNKDIDVEVNSYYFVGSWDSAKKSSSVLKYHTECFKSIAGKKYLDLLNKSSHLVDKK